MPVATVHRMFGVPSLRCRLLALVVLSVVPALGLMLNAITEWRRHEAAGAQANALRLARHASAIHERLIEETRERLVGLTQLPLVWREDPGECSRLLTTLRQQWPRYASLGVSRPDGETFCSAGPTPGPISIADRPSFRRAFDSRDFAVDVHRSGPASGEATAEFAYPILATAGRVQAVVFGTVTLAWFRELAAEARLPSGAAVTLLDQNGVVLAHHPEAEKQVGQSVGADPLVRAILERGEQGTGETTGLADVCRLFAVQPLAASKAGALFLAVSIPMSVVDAEPTRIMVRNLVALGVAAALAVVAAWVGGNVFILRRVKALAGATRRLSTGDLTARSGRPYGADELGQLGRTFDGMAAALEAKQAEADEARRALRATNEALERRVVELAALETRFRALIENASDGIVLLGADGRFLYASPSSARGSGRPVGDWIGRNVFEFIHPDDGEQMRVKFEELLRRPGAIECAEFRAQDRDGCWRWVEAVASNLLGEASVGAVVVNLRDVTDRKEVEATLRRAYDELEMRVRERTADLVEANEALQASQMRLVGIIGSAMDGIVTIDSEQRIVLFNAAAEEMFRCPATRAVGQNLDRFIPERFRAVHAEHIRVFGETGVTQRRLGQRFPVTGLRADGEEFLAEVSISQVEVGGRRLYTAIVRDVTQRRRAEEALQESEERMRLLLDSTAEAIYGLDLRGNVTFCNRACLRLLGYDDPHVLLGRNMHALMHHTRPDGTPYPSEECRTHAAFRQGEGTHADDEVFWRADGTSFAAEFWSFPVRRDGALVGAVVTFLDITERKRAEEELRRSREQLRDLAHHVEAAREEERTRIAREIHDELGQALTGVKVDLSWLAARLPQDLPAALGRKLGETVSLVDSTIQSVGRISADLRPSLLDDLGLAPAIEWHVQAFRARTGIDCALRSTLGDGLVDREVSTAVFRICQEALTNVARHAAATMVDIYLQADCDRLTLTIEDNGQGITEGQLTDPKSLGLLGIRERAHLLGGEATVVGHPGEGTTVQVQIPLKPVVAGAGRQGSHRSPTEDIRR